MSAAAELFREEAREVPLVHRRVLAERPGVLKVVQVEGPEGLRWERVALLGPCELVLERTDQPAIRDAWLTLLKAARTTASAAPRRRARP